MEAENNLARRRRARGRLHAADIEPPAPRRARLDPVAPGDHVLEDATYSQSVHVVTMWRAGNMCDVDVRVEGRSFRAHQVILASGSDMLRAAFSPEWLSSSGDDGVKVLTLSDVCADGFERVLEFLYTGTCAVGESTLTATLEAASPNSRACSSEKGRRTSVPISCIRFMRSITCSTRSGPGFLCGIVSSRASPPPPALPGTTAVEYVPRMSATVLPVWSLLHCSARSVGWLVTL